MKGHRQKRFRLNDLKRFRTNGLKRFRTNGLIWDNAQWTALLL